MIALNQKMQTALELKIPAQMNATLSNKYVKQIIKIVSLNVRADVLSDANVKVTIGKVVSRENAHGALAILVKRVIQNHLGACQALAA